MSGSELFPPSIDEWHYLVSGFSLGWTGGMLVGLLIGVIVA